MDRALAMLLARVLFGVLFLVGGIYKVFVVGPLAHAQATTVVPYARAVLPAWGLRAAGATIPFIELIAGALVLAGLFTRQALSALGIVLVLVLFTHLLAAPYYLVNSYTLTRTGLFAFLMLMPADADRYGLDRLLKLDR